MGASHTDPFFSIVCPTYNRKDFLKIAIESVLAQSFEDWELIIIDDGSTDDTKGLIDLYNDKRLKYRYQENQERSIARNNGIKLSSAAFICFLDSDDYYGPDHLKGLHKHILENSSIDAVYFSGYQLVDYRKHNALPKELASVSKNSEMAHRIDVPAESIEKRDIVSVLLERSIYPSSACVSKRILEEHRFHAEIRIWEDTFLWLNIATAYPFIPVEEISAYIVLHPANTISKLTDNQNYLEINTDINRKLRLLKSDGLKDIVSERHIKRAKQRWIYNAFYNAFLKSDRKLCAAFLKKYLSSDPRYLFQKATLRMMLDLLKT